MMVFCLVHPSVDVVYIHRYAGPNSPCKWFIVIGIFTMHNAALGPFRRLFSKPPVDSAEYFAYGVPFNSHELSYTFLGAVHSEPGHSVLK